MKFDEKLGEALKLKGEVVLVTDAGVFSGTVVEKGEDFIVLNAKHSWGSRLRRHQQERVIINGSLSAIHAVAFEQKGGKP